MIFEKKCKFWRSCLSQLSRSTVVLNSLLTWWVWTSFEHVKHSSGTVLAKLGRSRSAQRAQYAQCKIEQVATRSQRDYDDRRKYCVAISQRCYYDPNTTITFSPWHNYASISTLSRLSHDVKELRTILAHSCRSYYALLMT